MSKARRSIKPRLRFTLHFEHLNERGHVISLAIGQTEIVEVGVPARLLIFFDARQTVLVDRLDIGKELDERLGGGSRPSVDAFVGQGKDLLAVGDNGRVEDFLRPTVAKAEGEFDPVIAAVMIDDDARGEDGRVRDDEIIEPDAVGCDGVSIGNGEIDGAVVEDRRQHQVAIGHGRSRIFFALVLLADLGLGDRRLDVASGVEFGLAVATEEIGIGDEQFVGVLELGEHVGAVESGDAQFVGGFDDLILSRLDLRLRLVVERDDERLRTVMFEGASDVDEVIGLIDRAQPDDVLKADLPDAHGVDLAFDHEHHIIFHRRRIEQAFGALLKFGVLALEFGFEVVASIACEESVIGGRDNEAGRGGRLVGELDVLEGGIVADIEMPAGIERQPALLPVIGLVEPSGAFVEVGLIVALERGGLFLGLLDEFDRDGVIDLAAVAVLDDLLEISLDVETELDGDPAEHIMPLAATETFEFEVGAGNGRQARALLARTASAGRADRALAAPVGTENALPIGFDVIEC